VARRTLSYVTSGTSRSQREHGAVITLKSREHINENRAYIKVNTELEGNATVFAIDEDKLRRCSHIKLMIGEQEVVALVDSGAESSIISQELFESLINKGFPFYTYLW
jgi:hypothetical protein